MSIVGFLLRSPIVRRLVAAVRGNKISGVRRAGQGKRALLSYTVNPFKQRAKFLTHPNFIESFVLADALMSNGYDVDVFNNTFGGKIDYDRYDLIIGEGLPIANYFIARKPRKTASPVTVYYSTGSHPLFQNSQSVLRLLCFLRREGLYLPESVRQIDPKWAIGASAADYGLVIGDDSTVGTFRAVSPEMKLWGVRPPFHISIRDLSMTKKRRNSFLWFGSFGLLHKGLDVVLDFFIENPQYDLDVCGYLDREVRFMDVYRDRIHRAPNIHLNGFLRVDSTRFKDLMEQCTYVVLVSFSEGCSTGVVTAMGNGGLIPIVSRESGISGGDVRILSENSVEGLRQAIDAEMAVPESFIPGRAAKLRESTIRDYSAEAYTSQIRLRLNDILNAKR